VNEQVRAIDRREGAVVDLWQKGGLCRGTIISYLCWVRRFRNYCEKQRLVETEQLTVSGLGRFLRAYVGPRLKRPTSAPNSRNLANNALHAWACALHTLGTPLPAWHEKQKTLLPPLLNEFGQYRRVHNTDDANGNMTNDGVNTYTWDTRNHLSGCASRTGIRP
jgi:hypothetical protein